MDSAAKRLGIDAVEIRRRNLIDRFPYKTATGLTIDEGSYKETLLSAIAAADLPNFRARQREARLRGRYLGIGLATFTERTGFGTSAFAARGLEITVGFETVEVAMDPSGQCRGAHWHVAARPGPAHDTGPNYRRPTRPDARPDPRRSWRHRHDAVWLWHFRQPVNGIVGWCQPARRRKVAPETVGDRQPPAGNSGGRYRVAGRTGGRGWHRSVPVDRPDRPYCLSRGAKARCYRAGAQGERDLRSRWDFFQCLSCRHRRGRSRDRRCSAWKNSWRPRMPGD